MISSINAQTIKDRNVSDIQTVISENSFDINYLKDLKEEEIVELFLTYSGINQDILSVDEVVSGYHNYIDDLSKQDSVAEYFILGEEQLDFLFGGLY